MKDDSYILTIEAAMIKQFDAGYKSGYKRGSQLVQSYNEGLNDAWECACMLVCRTSEYEEIFGKDYDAKDILLGSDPYEILEKIRNYKKEEEHK